MARQVLDNGIVLPSEYSDDWYDDMTSNLTKLDEVIGSDAEKLDESDVGAAAISNDYDDLDDKPTYNILRRASVTLTAGGTGNYTDLDSDSKIKAGDYVLDAVNKLYSITAVDAANSTYTVSAAAIINITDKSELGAAALSNSYDDLNNLPGYGILRFCSTAITDNSSVPFSSISSVSKIAAGDFLLDTNGKLYQISSVDTANETVSVTTPLTQLAVDSNVMHLSGNETASGVKTFSSIGLTGYPSIRMYLSDDEWNVQPATVKQSELRFTDKNSVTVSYFVFQHRNDNTEPFRTCWRQQKMDGTSGYFSVNFNNLGEFYPENYNSIKLGKPNNRWLGVYAMNYYYGANDVEFSTKFVTSDTTQTISGAKTFSSTPFIYNSDTSGSTANLYFRNQLITKGDTSSSGNQTIRFADANDKIMGRIQSNKVSNGASSLNLRADTIDTSNNDVTVEVQILADRSGNKSFSPQISNDVNLGQALAKWKNVFVNQINTLTPSSLSMPGDTYLDISGYITDFSGGNNQYTAPGNGIVAVDISGTNRYVLYNNNLSIGDRLTGSNFRRAGIIQVRKNDTVIIQSDGGTLNYAKFYPCLGNV